MKKGGKRYFVAVPKRITAGRVLVHNHIIPQAELGANGFRAWTQQRLGK